jgi:hypothetical protein
VIEAGVIETMTTTISLVGIMLLASAFLLGHVCHRFTVSIKRRWQALSAGVAVAYVFVNVMPELEEHRKAVSESVLGTFLDAEKRIYLWALAGFLVFAGISRLKVVARENAGTVYWGSMTGWALYTMLIGYLLLHREDASMLSLWLFVFAMGLHIFMLDNELAEKFEDLYEPWGRLVLVVSLFIGWAMGVFDVLPESFTSRLFAFVIGGVIITSAHEEMSVEESGRFWWFVGGAGLYATLLMLI